VNEKLEDDILGNLKNILNNYFKLNISENDVKEEVVISF
jgi:hypothetical protein